MGTIPSNPCCIWREGIYQSTVSAACAIDAGFSIPSVAAKP
jgi:hypothetical protein